MKEEMLPVIQEMLVKANKARLIAEGRKTRVAEISIQWAVYNSYVSAAGILALKIGMSTLELIRLNERIWVETIT